MVEQLRKRASDLQKKVMEQTLQENKELLNDPRGLIAMNEMNPLTYSALGFASDDTMSELRKKYPSIVTKTNNIATGMMQCDCCLSQMQTSGN